MVYPILILVMELVFILILIYNLSLIHRVNLKVITQESVYNYYAMILILNVK